MRDSGRCFGGMADVVFVDGLNNREGFCLPVT